MSTASGTDRSEQLRAASTWPARFVVVHAVLVYLFFLGVLVYSAGFFIGVDVPKGIDDGSPRSVAPAVAVDLMLLTLFAGQHTVMARPWFKRVWTRVVPPAAERSTFVLAASLLLALLCWLWQPIDATVWRVHGAVGAPLLALYVAGWVLAIGSTYQIDHADLFGLRQAWCGMRSRPYQPPCFVERGLYRQVRHPLMAGFIVIFWATPVMSAGHLLFAAAATAYIGVGIAFEERDLLRDLGPGYARYRSRVPALIPRVRLRPRRPVQR